MKEFIRKFDYYPKLSDDVETIKTSCGGFLFLSCVLASFLLIVCDINNYFSHDQVHSQETLVYQSNRSKLTKTFINISFPYLPCDAIFFAQHNFDFDLAQPFLYKLPINEEGLVINIDESDTVRKLAKNLDEQEVPEGANLECWGAQLFSNQICQTCADVVHAYSVKHQGKSFVPFIFNSFKKYQFFLLVSALFSFLFLLI